MGTQRLAKAEPRIPDPRTALAAELEHSIALLSRSPIDDDAAHELRRSIKRARSVLRLLREAVGDKAYERENRALRDAARALAPMRDAKVLRDALASLGAPARVPRTRPAPAKRVLRALLEAREHTANWRMPREKWPAVAAGIKRMYRHGRDALHAAEARPTDRNLHESRKEIKRLGAALEFLEPAGAKRVRKARRRADAAARDLGDDHDLALLARRPPGGRLPPALRTKVVKRRRKYQKRALKKARRLFGAKPGKFLKQLSRARVRT